MSESHISGESPTGAKVAEQSEERRPRHPHASREVAHESPMGAPQDFLNNRFVYVVISARARGLSVGVNMSPAKLCNFDCLYCEVNRQVPARDGLLDVEVMATELEQTIHYFQSRRLPEHPLYGSLPQELLQMRHVALSGHGEPTLCPNFVEAVQAVAHLRALGRVPFFKIVMITNGTALDSPTVQAGLKFFSSTDEIWVKLDAGTQQYMDIVNRSEVPLQKVLDNILALGRQRPVIIQSLFAAYKEQEPPPEEIAEYAQRLQELKAAGAQISMVQIYSATRPVHHAACGHLPLRTLSRIAQTVRTATGLRVEVF
jgi:wyosine [tRNA(Phe)-imidazoG37] synthetase (radical SAM superfamily)